MKQGQGKAGLLEIVDSEAGEILHQPNHHEDPLNNRLNLIIDLLEVHPPRPIHSVDKI